jgi:N-hydroxyarylamine O-acetyltransferase
MAESAIDLEAYCRRIGYTGPREATLAVLRELQRRHAMAIPFENLDVLLGRRITLEPAALERKLVQEGRGGYCFEQNTLFLHVLRGFGFAAEPLIARMRWQVPAEIPSGLTHMRVRVDLAGRPYLGDVGMGTLTLTAPLALDETGEQPTGLDRRRLLARGDQLLEQVNFGSGWLDVCLFSPAPAAQPDFELGNWYSHTHPQAKFVQNFLVARPEADRRYAISNREFSMRHVDGTSRKEVVASPEQLRTLLERHFGLTLPPGAPLVCPGLIWDQK